MSYLKQPIAVQANHQDGVTGCFWDGRFHSQKITNLRQLLAAMVYIDLNPIRAGMAKTPEESRYTGVFERIRAMQQRLKWAARNKGREPQVTKHRQEKLERDVHAQVDDWLSPVEFDEHIEQTIDCASAPIDPALQPDVDSAEQAVGWKPSSRASDRGILPISLTKYLLLVDWTGRQLRRGKRGKIPDELPSILVRLGISDSAGWLSILQDYAERLVSRFSAPANQTSELALSRSLDDEFESVTRHAFL